MTSASVITLMINLVWFAESDMIVGTSVLDFRFAI